MNSAVEFDRSPWEHPCHRDSVAQQALDQYFWVMSPAFDKGDGALPTTSKQDTFASVTSAPSPQWSDDDTVICQSDNDSVLSDTVICQSDSDHDDYYKLSPLSADVDVKIPSKRPLEDDMWPEVPDKMLDKKPRLTAFPEDSPSWPGGGTVYEGDGSDTIHFRILLYRPERPGTSKNMSRSAKFSFVRLSDTACDLREGSAILEGTIKRLSQKAHETRKRRYDYGELCLQSIGANGMRQTLKTRAWKDVRTHLNTNESFSKIKTSDLTSVVEQVVFPAVTWSDPF